ncbi:uncharacterized protein CcaverHIS019_0208760 [Cutaneotrichosporon cavernicola]|uniref:Uncharacterized protein n=1 Tax=Cutaneotrichosporon cavernicola TaxID=279322 RepID=A0AA48I1K0_9TREE|nr:uncharacterized protein CcaverHIS019_0208760 [Cutaneotrichosporon cavernicola]BEI89514.1 hypothetical protein CcaverHIS019_0208760 [Cutaneotrichosporon cavernicola]BEI97287.1 hypothetical protein CcaverHIS631_0208760 [Cutaneotrichosporon cavernicola]BEJ05061.1 hypothetical protein CcaverHIS641_0208780 [Cutaneotrichosporon cavernicola]
MLSRTRPVLRPLASTRLVLARSYTVSTEPPKGQDAKANEPPLPPPPAEQSSSKTFMIIAVAAAIAGAAFVPWYKSEKEGVVDTEHLIRERELVGDRERIEAEMAAARR